ncbi:MAG: hypothetical protein JSW29_03220 [Candidatus Bathyarchaeota archaeon]|nr:MAG: hypothetical protein JSW29_03220 [Candidatus Bathyarchaeota archaeon]
MSVWRFWAAGMVFIVAAWISLIPIVFFQGFLEFLMIESGNVAIPLVYALAYLVIVPYTFGRIVKWVSEKFFRTD